MNRAVLIAGALLTLPMLVFLAIGLQHDPRQIDSPLIGQPAPQFALQDLDGQRVSLEDLRGRPVLLNFWATYCVPCVAEHGTFQAATRRLGDEVVFLGVIYHDETALIRRFLERRGTWGQTLVDPEAQVAIAYGVYGVPETYLIDREGVIVDKLTAPLMNTNQLFGWLNKHGLLPL